MAPEMIEDELLGRLIRESRLEWWRGEVEISPGHEVSVSFRGEEAGVEEGVARARRTYEFIRGSEERIRRYAARGLLEIYNQEWNDGDALGEDEFIAEMSMEGISFHADGDAEVYYDEGGLFFGHTIVVSVGPNLEITDTDIAG